MGIGPVPAIRKLLAKTGLKIDQIDLFEVNEAFASQALYCVRELGLPVDRVNVNGGAIALGHPLGATGARQIATALHELERRKGRYAVITMCVGGGMGAAGLIERRVARNDPARRLRQADSSRRRTANSVGSRSQEHLAIRTVRRSAMSYADALARYSRSVPNLPPGAAHEPYVVLSPLDRLRLPSARHHGDRDAHVVGLRGRRRRRRNRR